MAILSDLRARQFLGAGPDGVPRGDGNAIACCPAAAVEGEIVALAEGLGDGLAPGSGPSAATVHTGPFAEPTSH